jgi:hypothetical protein
VEGPAVLGWGEMGGAVKPRVLVGIRLGVNAGMVTYWTLSRIGNIYSRSG